MPSRLTQNRLGTSVFLTAIILALIFAVLRCFSKVETKRCCAFRSLKVDASPVAGAVAVRASCFCAEFSFEQALTNKVDANAQASASLDP